MSHTDHWSKLPSDLSEQIFSRLPIAAVLRCRAVSKHFLSLLSSSSFLQLWETQSPRHFWFLVYHTPHVIAAFDPHTSRWNNLPVFRNCVLTQTLTLTRSLPLASSGGLLCFLNRSNDPPKLTVCNPLIGSYRILPPLSEIRYIDIVGMVADRTRNSYIVLVTGTVETTSGDSITEIYDSRTGTWTRHCRAENEFLLSWYEVRAIWHEGAFYCLSAPNQTLICYDLEKKRWRDLRVWLPHGGIKRASLLSFRKKLLLAGKLMDGFSSRCICIWELERLEDGGFQWVRIGTMSEGVFSEMDFPYMTFIRCYGQENLICFTSNQGWKSIMYDMEKEMWARLPDNPECESDRPQKWGRNNLVGLTYEPSFLARV